MMLPYVIGGSLILAGAAGFGGYLHGVSTTQDKQAAAERDAVVMAVEQYKNQVIEERKAAEVLQSKLDAQYNFTTKLSRRLHEYETTPAASVECFDPTGMQILTDIADGINSEDSDRSDAVVEVPRDPATP